MFGRGEKQGSTSTVEESAKAGGKGRATPSRREAQAAAKQRARQGLDKKTTAKRDRERRAETQARAREGMKNGEEKYLMARDKGPVRRFVRDYVDHRLSFMEFLLPVLVVILLGQGLAPQAFTYIWNAVILLLLADVVWLFLALGRELKRRFPDEDTRGWRFYALMRAIQVRPLRMPKTQKKIGEKLPERY